MLGAYLSRWERDNSIEVAQAVPTPATKSNKLYKNPFSILGTMSVKVTVDQDACTACGLCYNDECPDVFMEGSDGNSNLKPEFQKGGIDKGEIPDDKKACAQSAVDACPVNAIVVG
jgi:ferredoxin